MLKSILLVLNEPAASSTSELIRVHGLAVKVATAYQSREAINYLISHEAPELIVLDINLPVDFQCIFLHEFGKLQPIISKVCKILIVTDRHNEDKLVGLPLQQQVIGFKPLPLDAAGLSEVIGKM